jgi:hypothetical protein
VSDCKLPPFDALAAANVARELVASIDDSIRERS